jgi:hypothetical protein
VKRGEVWCADVLQCYVDLAQYIVRGEEQAEEIPPSTGVVCMTDAAALILPTQLEPRVRCDRSG